MKKYSLFLSVFLLAIITGNSFSQCYTVLSVKGEIISEKTGQPIKEMDEICATDKLKFSTKDSKAAVLSSDQGRFVVKVSGKNTNNELIAFVNSVLFAGKERLSTKLMEFDDEQMNLNLFKDEFGVSYFVINESRVYADTSVYKLNEINYFSLNYLYDGKEIEKKLKFEKNCLVIRKDVLEDANPDSIEFVSIYYNNIGKKESKKLASFKLFFLEEQILKELMSSFTSILKKAGKENYYIVEQSQFLFNDLYGNVNYYDLSTYLENNFGIKGY
ncbi:MAG: hypothetical protein HY959_13320 [Ignavibacteriae bacterium]|nr:hypothetical protein [Ignavibacteriota bacterium]